MKKGRTLLAVAALVATAPFVGLGTASAKPPAFGAKVLSVKFHKHDTNVAYVRAQYVCDKAPGAAWHLWASLKQNASGTRDPALEQEGSSAVATTWLQSHPVNFKCDGRRHVQRFTIDTVEQGFGHAVKGKGWVQFCLIDFADASNQRAAIVQEWRSVRD
jgi:hypothetical protein